MLPVPSGHLLIGTQKRGLLVYDGETLKPFHSTLEKVFVTELAGTDSDLWIGTQEKGVAHWHGGSVEWFDESNGMPDARVYSIALDGDRTMSERRLESLSSMVGSLRECWRRVRS